MIHWDYQLFTYFNGFAGSNRALDVTMIFIARWGIFLYLLILGRFWQKTGKAANRRLKLAVRTGLAAVLALAINQAIGLIYFRPRPFMDHQVNLLVKRTADASFPSDHTAFAAALTGALSGQGRKTAAFLTVFTVVLGISRVYVGTHYLLDVLGGFCTGVFGNFLVCLCWPKIDGLIDRVSAFVYKH